jgi:hypothetical protein
VSGYDKGEAIRQGLWEQLDAMTANAVDRLDRLWMGDELYEHSERVAAEVRKAEHDRDLELYRLAVRMGKKNRGEE